MKYKCPYCRSEKKPKEFSYFTPEIVRCTDCSKIALEKEFIKDSPMNISLIQALELYKIKY